MVLQHALGAIRIANGTTKCLFEHLDNPLTSLFQIILSFGWFQGTNPLPGEVLLQRQKRPYRQIIVTLIQVHGNLAGA
jgi:hypothetical protein